MAVNLLGNSDADARVILNVGGTRFETLKSTLKKLPATRLSKLTEQLSYYDPILNEYFFDRHPGVFSQILNYYRTGKLHYPTNVCGPLFEDELSYWSLQREDVEPCCWMTYTKHRSTAETLSILDSLELDTVRSSKQEVLKKFGWDDNYEYVQGRLPKYKKMMMITWQIFEEPRSSTVAKVVTVISIFFILVSILSFVLQTLSMFRITEIDFVNVYVNKTTTDRTPTLNRQQVHPTFDIVEWICNSWFIFEIVIRFIVSPSKKEFSKSILNIIDFLATLWFFFTWALIKLNVNDNEALDLLSTIRIMRLFKLFNHHPGLKVIITSMKYSSSVLWLLIFFVLIAVAIFASLIYYAERMTTKHPDENMFTSIPDALWFNMITMSTIGYGDYYPKTMLGMLIGAVATVAGVLIIDLPMPIIVESFANFYTHLRARSKLPKTRRKIGPAETLMKKRTAITTIENAQNLRLLGQAAKTSMFGSKTMINNNRMSSMA
ncbi:unnamed protein product [Rotaria socialis]|uniref:BTB domain-containing protein n=1 Tax=Rotaria socialis TaxID=392032 RepID=A0A818CZQ3_9BILA|nr:unnamed protein product [Rotaria socialis]CAF3630103.1 unnamed protein product [Rotaria socialis]CAF4232605.1 unnamed protein product [Rotaria socialis]CAF4493416.1 unnamed protein product [Rotaria socialis]